MKRLVLVLVVVFGLSGCISYVPPVQKDIATSRTFNLDKETTWLRITQWLSSNGFMVREIDKASGFLGADGSIKELEGFTADTWSGVSLKNPLSDCGKGGMVMPIPLYAQFNFFVETTNNVTSVRIFVKFTDFSFPPNSVEFKCYSNGVVEKMIFDYIGK